jgi:hypothetical protein
MRNLKKSVKRVRTGLRGPTEIQVKLISEALEKKANKNLSPVMTLDAILEYAKSFKKLKLTEKKSFLRLSVKQALNGVNVSNPKERKKIHELMKSFFERTEKKALFTESTNAYDANHYQKLIEIKKILGKKYNLFFTLFNRNLGKIDKIIAKQENQKPTEILIKPLNK